jgi:hypothetical protein
MLNNISDDDDNYGNSLIYTARERTQFSGMLRKTTTIETASYGTCTYIHIIIQSCRTEEKNMLSVATMACLLFMWDICSQHISDRMEQFQVIHISKLLRRVAGLCVVRI